MDNLNVHDKLDKQPRFDCNEGGKQSIPISLSLSIYLGNDKNRYVLMMILSCVTTIKYLIDLILVIW